MYNISLNASIDNDNTHCLFFSLVSPPLAWLQSSVAVLDSRQLHSSSMLLEGGDKQGETHSSNNANKGGRDANSDKGPNAAVPPLTVSMSENDKPDLLDLVSGYKSLPYSCIP